MKIHIYLDYLKEFLNKIKLEGSSRIIKAVMLKKDKHIDQWISSEINSY